MREVEGRGDVKRKTSLLAIIGSGREKKKKAYGKTYYNKTRFFL